MKYASSIKYGGNLVNAKGCDYNSYKHLGLICPECKNAVFLRVAHTRTAPRSKERVEVEQSFAHFKAVDPAVVLSCENRVAAYDKTDLKKKATAAKNQRLKLLHRWFWDIYYRCFELERRIVGIEQREGRQGLTDVATRLAGEPEMKLVIDSVRRLTSDEVEAIVESHVLAFGSAPQDRVKSIFVQSKIQFLSGVDRTMHILICTEVIEFLRSSRQKPLLEKLVAISKVVSEQSSYLQQQIALGLDRLPAALVRHLIISICFIDWGSEFERLKDLKGG